MWQADAISFWISSSKASIDAPYRVGPRENSSGNFIRNMRMSNKTSKVIMAVVLFLVAGLIFIKNRPGSDVASSVNEAPREFVCTKCNIHFQLPAKEAMAALDAAPEPPPLPITDAPRARAMRDSRPPKMIKCTKCGKDAAVSAQKCELHGVFFPLFNADGTRGQCPQCPKASTGLDGSANVAEAAGFAD